MLDLNLNLSRADFEAVKSGEKKFVMHPVGPLWRRILEGREFSRVLFKHAGEVFACSWFGYEHHFATVKVQIHQKHSRFDSVPVFAIRVGVAL